MSTRALCTILAVSIVNGLLIGVLFPRVGYWAYLLVIAVGVPAGITTAKWDIRTGKQGWFS